jgi:hypothetical membrane protein
MGERTAGLAGIVAPLIFWPALVGFAAAYPGYTHAHKAISELGAFGAPHALAWNLVGFLTPGLLLAVCGAGLARSIDVQGRRTALYWLLVLSGVGFAGAGVFPVEMRDGSPFMGSPFTMGHVVMTFLSGIPWTIAAFLAIPAVERNPAWRPARRLAVMLAVVAVAGFLVNVTASANPMLEHRPGLAQRISFAVYFAWFLVMALQLRTRMPGTRQAPAAR